jgi:hypothetical protein
VGHVEIEIGVGRFEAFALIETQVVSSVQESVAGALVWLSGRFVASVMSGGPDSQVLLVRTARLTSTP